MSKYRVGLTSEAYAYVTVEADDPDSAIEAAFEEAPTICAHCAGWGQLGWSLEIGDEWSLDEESVEVVEDDSEGAR